VLTNGSLQGLAFLAGRLAPLGRVFVEVPTYDRPLKLLGDLGADVTGIALDDEGLDVDLLEAELRQGPPASFLYTIPTFQNPSGRTLSNDRRRRLVELARAHELLIVEDDPYGLVRYEGEAPPSLRDLEGGDRVTYTSSFSKTVAPGLRVGWFVLPEPFAKPYEERAVSTYISPPFLPQAIVHELAARGAFEPNLERIKGLLRTRRDAMLDALDRELAGTGASWSRPEGGYFVWLELPGGTDAAALLDRATEAGVTFVRGSDFFPAGEGRGSSARLAFSYESPERISEGVALLAELLRR
jgi:2-aminoadipate transaminase